MVTKKDKLLATAQKFLEKGNLDKALAEFQKAVQEDGRDTRTWLRIAELHVKRGDNDKATDVYFKTADLYVEQGFFQRAVAVYKNIIKLSPNFVDAYSKLADIYKQLGLLSDAVQQYDLAAAAFQRMGKVKDAIAAMRQIVDINPDQAVPWIKLAEAAAQAGMMDEAIANLSRAAELLKGQGRIDEYLRVAERLSTYQPDNIVLAKQVALHHIERNNARGALAKLQGVFKTDPRDTETLDLLARAFEQLQQPRKAIQVLKELARIYQEAERFPERNFTAQRILSLEPSDAEAQEWMGRNAPVEADTRSQPLASPGMEMERPRRATHEVTFSEMVVPDFLMPKFDAPESQPPSLPVSPAPEPPVGAKNTAERVAIAAGMLEKTDEEAAADVQRMVSEADVFVKYGLIERAVEHLRRVFELVPTHTGAHERLAAVLLQLGRKSEAVAELETLAEQLASTDPEAAVGHARRAMAVDPNANRARSVLAAIERQGWQNAPRTPLPVREGDLLEMGTPEPEVLSDEELIEISNSGAIALGTTISSSPLTDDNEFVVDRTAGGERDQPALMADLDQVDFFLEQGLMDEAQTLIDDLDTRYPSNPAVRDRRRRLNSLTYAPGEEMDDTTSQKRRRAPVTDEVKDDTFSEERQSTAGAIPGAPSEGTPAQGVVPRAMVAGGGAPDMSTHRDLGIAYKEMGLFDAAINEFNAVIADSAQEVFALTMIGECFEAKGAPADAVGYYKKALNRTAVSEPESTQLYYQLGNAFQVLGDLTEALYFFEKVAKRDPNFRDARRRVADIKANGSGSADGAGAAPGQVGTQEGLGDAFDAILGGGKGRGQ